MKTKIGEYMVWIHTIWLGGCHGMLVVLLDSIDDQFMITVGLAIHASSYWQVTLDSGYGV